MTSPPPLRSSLTELPRSGLEFSSALFQLPKIIKQAPKGNQQPVLALPGYGGGDTTTALLRYFLKQIGYSAHALNLGRNYEPPKERIMRVEDAVTFREKMSALVAKRIEALHQQSGQAVTLIGWSMGGLYALDASQQLPEKTQRVLTLGAPFGDPRGTAAFNLLRKMNRSNVPIEEQNFDLWLNKCNIKSNAVPIKVIHSATDGIVGAGTSQLNQHPSIEHIEVKSSHMGFTVNPEVYKIIAQLLAQ